MTQKQVYQLGYLNLRSENTLLSGSIIVGIYLRHPF